MNKSFYVGAYCSELSLGNKLIRFFWSIAYNILFKPSPVLFFAWRVLLLRAFGAKIKDKCKIYPTVKVWLPSNLRIGELVSKPIKISTGAWIFSNAFISLDVTVNKGAIVAAGSVVVKDVKAFDVVGGNPAKFLKKRETKWLNS